MVRSGPSNEQKEHIAKAVRKNIRLICQAWPVANEEALAFAYGSGSNGSEAVVATSETSDTTGNRAMQIDHAGSWLKKCNGALRLILSLSAASASSERRWTGPFNPPAMVNTLCAAAEDLIDLWPLRVDKLWRKLDQLAGTAGTRWPETPKVGQTIQTVDGPVTVGKHGLVTEVCAECKQQMNGGAADPIRRLDGKPYHKAPCYETVRKRKQRATSTSTVSHSA